MRDSYGYMLRIVQDKLPSDWSTPHDETIFFDHHMFDVGFIFLAGSCS